MSSLGIAIATVVCLYSERLKVTITAIKPGPKRAFMDFTAFAWVPY